MNERAYTVPAGMHIRSAISAAHVMARTWGEPVRLDFNGISVEVGTGDDARDVALAHFNAVSRERERKSDAKRRRDIRDLAAYREIAARVTPLVERDESGFDWLDTMMIGLCAHGAEGVPTEMIQSWFDAEEWTTLLAVLRELREVHDASE